MKTNAVIALCGVLLAGAGAGSFFGIQQYTVSSIRSAVESSGGTVKKVEFSLMSRDLRIEGLHIDVDANGQKAALDVDSMALRPELAFLPKLCGFGTKPGSRVLVTDSAVAAGIRVSMAQAASTIDSARLSGGLSCDERLFAGVKDGSEPVPQMRDFTFGAIEARNIGARDARQAATMKIAGYVLRGWDGHALEEAAASGCVFAMKGLGTVRIGSCAVNGFHALPAELSRRAAAYDPKSDPSGLKALDLLADLMQQDKPLFSRLTLSDIQSDAGANASQDCTLKSLSFDWASSKPWNSTLAFDLAIPLKGELAELGTLMPSVKALDARVSFSLDQQQGRTFRTVAKASLPGLCDADADVTATCPAAKDILSPSARTLAALTLHKGSCSLADKGLLAILYKLGDDGTGGKDIDAEIDEMTGDITGMLGKNGLSEAVNAFLRRPGKLTVSLKKPISGTEMMLAAMSPASCITIEAAPGPRPLADQVRALVK